MIIRSRYELYVGNIGMVYSGPSPIAANRAWGEYKRQSLSGYGRASHENLTLFRDGDIIRELVWE